MAELIVDFAEIPDGPFRGTDTLPPPVVFIREYNDEGRAPVLSGPLRGSERTAFGTVSRIEDLCQVRGGRWMGHPPGSGGFQTVQQAFGMMSCPNLAMEVETVIPPEPVTSRKWVAWWLIPEDEYLRIGGNVSTAADPDFQDVVKNRLPLVPRNSILFRMERINGWLAWLVQFTGAPGRPASRNQPWNRIDEVGSLNEQRIMVRGSNLVFQARRADGRWATVLTERDVVPPDWAEKRIVFLVEATDYESWDGSKGDGRGPATRVIERVRLRAPQVFDMVDAPPVEEPAPPVQEPEPEPEAPVEPPPVEEPDPEPPVNEEPEPPEEEPEEPPVEEPEPVPAPPVSPQALRALADWVEAVTPQGAG